MPEVHLQSHLSYRNVAVTSENKLVYLLGEVAPSAGLGLGPAALNLAIVLDKSGSMYAHDKLEYVISAVGHVMEKLRASDIACVIAFADKARVLIPASQIYDRESARRMVRNIDSIDVGSGTEMLNGIRAANDELRKNLSAERMNHMILLTDGLTLHEGACKEACMMAAAEGISVSTIGVGDDFNEQFLLDIATACRGTSYYIDIPRDIPAIFDQELKGVQNVVVRNPRLSLKLSRDISIRKAYKVKPMINDLGALPTADRVASIDLGEIQKDETQSYLFELVLPSRKPGTYRLAKTEVMFDIPELGVRDKTVSDEVLITYTEDQSQASVVTPQVMSVVDAVSVFRQQTRALEFAASGDRGKATQLLRSAATQLLSQGQQELANQALEEAGRIEQGGGASSAGTKKLQYGTRKLTQLLEPLDIPSLTGEGQE